MVDDYLVVYPYWYKRYNDTEDVYVSLCTLYAFSTFLKVANSYQFRCPYRHIIFSIGIISFNGDNNKLCEFDSLLCQYTCLCSIKPKVIKCVSDLSVTYLGTPGSFTYKIDHHCKAEILLKATTKHIHITRLCAIFPFTFLIVFVIIQTHLRIIKIIS